jgi:hypothetical protein
MTNVNRVVLNEGSASATRASLLASLSAYVSEDDVTLDRQTFLRYVCDRITDDLTEINSK